MLGQIFPINLCGVWSLISTFNPRLDNSARLEINYNNRTFNKIYR